MGTKKFHDIMRAIGLGDDDAWAGVVEEDGELDRVMDKAMQEVCLCRRWVVGPQDLGK